MVAIVRAAPSAWVTRCDAALIIIWLSGFALTHISFLRTCTRLDAQEQF